MSTAKPPRSSRPGPPRVITGAAFIAAGVLHFVIPDFYARVVPPIFGWPYFWTYFTGVAEIAGGAGLLTSRLRRPATMGLVALLVCVWPVHFYMAIRPDVVSPGQLPMWLVWLRLPLQVPMITWTAWAGFRGK